MTGNGITASVPSPVSRIDNRGTSTIRPDPAEPTGATGDRTLAEDMVGIARLRGRAGHARLRLGALWRRRQRRSRRGRGHRRSPRPRRGQERPLRGADRRPLGKLLIHPEPVAAPDELWARAAIGPVPGQLVLLAGLAFHGGWAAVAVITLRARRGRGRARTPPEEDRVLELARQAA